jgi:hypothetical protein
MSGRDTRYAHVPRTKNSDLIAIHMRFRRQDVDAARRIAKERAMPYQHVLRGWVADRAELEHARKREKMRG